MSARSTRTLPSSGSQMFSSSLQRVDLPAALGPMMARDCPAGMRKETPLMMARPPAVKQRFSAVSSPSGSGRSMQGGVWGASSRAFRRL